MASALRFRGTRCAGPARRPVALTTVAIDHGIRPGLIAEIGLMHARLYAEEHGLGPGFESYQLEQLGRFLAGYDPGRDAVLSAADDRGLMASLVVDGAPHPEGSAALRIRWVLLAPRARGLGLGSRLMDRAIAFIDDAGCASWLSTFAGLDTARGLYERRGFRLSEEIESAAWDRPLVMQRFDRPQMPC